AKLHQHIAWFYVHSGYTTSSIAEALYSARLYELVYKKTGDKDALRELGGSGLIASNSRLIQGNPGAALSIFNLSREATTAANLALNLEFFRQFGVAYAQSRQDASAKAMFEQAMRSIPDADLKNPNMTLRMASERHLNLIAHPFPRVEQQVSLLHDARGTYGPYSLH